MGGENRLTDEKVFQIRDQDFAVIEELFNCWYDNERHNGAETKLNIFALRQIHQILIRYDDVFGKIAREIVYDWKDIRSRKKSFSDIDIYDNKGFVIYESTQAGMGAFNHFYRAKGNRMLWFEDGTIVICNVYIDINEDGCQYWSTLEWERFNIYEVEGDLNECGTPIWNDCLYDILAGLTHINKAFHHDYPIEYFLTPADVAFLSDFSVDLQDNIWNMAVDIVKRALQDGKDSIEIDAFEWLAGKMSRMSIEPKKEHMIELCKIFIEEKGAAKEYDYDVIARRILEAINGNSEMAYSEFTDGVIEVLYSLQNQNIYKETEENERNSYLKEILSNKYRKMRFEDQTLKGVSVHGQTSGEVDIWVGYAPGRPYTIIEALNLNCVNRKIIHEHISKIATYDTAGLETNYVIIYYEGKNITGFWKKYQEYIQNTQFNNYGEIGKITEHPTNYADIRAFIMEYERKGIKRMLYHICVDMHI